MSDKQLVEKELLQFMFQKEDQQRRKLMASNNSLANQVKNSGEVNIGQRNMLMQAKSDVMDGYQMQSMLNFPEYGRANVNIPRAEVLNMHQTPMNAFINQKASTSMYPFLGSLSTGLPPSIQQNTFQPTILQGHVGVPSVTGLIPNNMTGTKQLQQEELKSLFSNESGLNSQLDPFSIPREEGSSARSNKRKLAVSQTSPIMPVGDATALLSSSNIPNSHDARVEKKKIREKKRRSELTDKFQILSSLLWEIEEAGLMKEGNTTTTNEEPVEGSEEPDQKKQKQSVVDAAVPGNRIDVIGRAVEVLRSFRDMNQSLKEEIAELKKQFN